MYLAQDRWQHPCEMVFWEFLNQNVSNHSKMFIECLALLLSILLKLNIKKEVWNLIWTNWHDWEFLQYDSPTGRQMKATVQTQKLIWLVCSYIVESHGSQRPISHLNKISGSGSTFAWMNMCKNKNLNFQNSVIIAVKVTLLSSLLKC